ncbi:MAG TPA: UDP-N-acetylglucosamine 2-epimerase (non-hydrolyzing) [Candidatus Bathyarchaeota archaeon]|nr:UDP-N-acetylglucosamine 2-epimerase (non-hydrolyzing) [Candidatus Bathyarchaeota archaeon]
MKTAIILGTRPEIIKMSPVIQELQRQELDYFILHTGQHYSYSMDRLFFEELNLPEPKYNLDVGSGSHAEETAKMLTGVEKVLLEEKPDVVLVEGDTNSVLAGALAAVKLGVNVGHVEAGLRSYDRGMPEETNRVLTDHMSDFLFAPTESARRNLLREGIADSKIFVTGNTIVDVAVQNSGLLNSLSNTLNDMNVEGKDYFLVTAHRQENVDDRERFQGILDGLKLIRDEFGIPLIYPVHPRAKKKMNTFALKPEGVTLIEPVGYLHFLRLESKAKLILTDSGGIQEEACILGVPCVTLRDNTERPETLEVGSNVLAGTRPEEIVKATRLMLDRSKGWKNPFGDGKAGKTIVKILMNKF